MVISEYNLGSLICNRGDFQVIMNLGITKVIIKLSSLVCNILGQVTIMITTAPAFCLHHPQRDEGIVYGQMGGVTCVSRALSVTNLKSYKHF